MEKFDFKKMGSSLARPDCEAATKAVQALYVIVGKKQPNEIIWVKSPLQAVKFSKMMEGRETKDGWGANIKDVMFNTMSTIFRRYAPGVLDRRSFNSSSPLDLTKQTIRTDLKFGNKEQICGSLYASFWCDEYHELYASLGRNDRDLKSSERIFIESMSHIMQHASWIIPYQNKCILAEKPTAIHLNDNGELHYEDGHAIKWADGWGVYSLEGRLIPSWIITNPENITVKLIRKERNLEVRRLMISKMGISKYLDQCKAKVVDMDSIHVFKAGDDRTMPRALMEDDEGNRYLVGTDGSTERVYYMNVDPNCKTCSEAHSSIAGFAEINIIANS
jgi:hypothetical protein